MSPESTPNRYQLPLISMVGALLVVLALVSVDRVWRALNDGGGGVGIPTVDYSGWVRSAKQDGRLHVLVPSTVPSGWRATSASYDAGALPVWHLGMLVDEKTYVGLDESLMTMDDLVAKYLSAGAERGPDVTVRGVVWHSWTDSRGDYALTRSFAAPKGKFPENVLVGGSAEPVQVREYVASLR